MFVRDWDDVEKLSSDSRIGRGKNDDMHHDNVNLTSLANDMLSLQIMSRRRRGAHHGSLVPPMIFAGERSMEYMTLTFPLTARTGTLFGCEDRCAMPAERTLCEPQ